MFELSHHEKASNTPDYYFDLVMEGYLPVLENTEQAIKVMNLMAVREAKGMIEHGTQRTKALIYKLIPALIKEKLVQVTLEKIPIEELKSITQKNEKRTASMSQILEQPADLSKVPPPVIYMDNKGEWNTLDGKTRISTAAAIGADFIYAYVVYPYDPHSSKNEIKPEELLSKEELSTILDPQEIYKKFVE